MMSAKFAHFTAKVPTSHRGSMVTTTLQMLTRTTRIITAIILVIIR
ncbi:TPA: hypothetical protein ACX6QF_001692 [Photobacterium damselae]|uniref:Uncharacterized protein n=2 Tax=Photobacterium damselae TaxID=38293 RepID=A0A2X1XPY3_PHODM|nr:hypothetical protein [Photobacterium damselae]ELI6448187.1 hypothetical protein [Photobacterium damselae]MBA5684905.1 hypothetical protein [Photobacterium damselae subsp. damselae]MCG3816223.1 hypothetical protein [Photobacterium damselae]MCG9703913.1 hypothetical protein [Photobacterium damselae]NVH51439.1 hypothetical protein [Photobacterium damselae subsp. damselae]